MKNTRTALISLSIAGLISLVSSGANAKKWIIKNPKQTVNLQILEGVTHHTTLNLKNDYLIIDTNQERMSPQYLANLFSAEAVFEDIKIKIDKPIFRRSEDPSKFKAWHVEKLNYKNLNPKYKGKDVIVAVLDTGVDYLHPALENKMWKNKKEIPYNKIDDDNNGLIDDHHGYNFNENLSDPADTAGHGTHCAGLIAADKDPNSNAQGIAPEVQIMPLLIISGDYEGFLSGAARAVKYATDNGAKILSNSWRIYRSMHQYLNEEALEMLEESIHYAEDHDVIFVAAAGNERRNLEESNLENPIYPLSFKGLKNIVGVAASTVVTIEGEEVEKMAFFSNYGIKSIGVAAPGEDIYSTVPDGQWTTMSGTSMATPIVAGALARGLSKGYNMEEAISELNKTSEDTTYWQQYITHGRINIRRYLR